MIRKLYIKSNTCNVYCISNHVSGNEMPVVFIHGLGSSSTDFSDINKLDYFKKRNFIIPDLPGFGRSDKLYGYSYDLQEQADLLKHVLSELGYRKADILGHSMGGVIAILFAKKFPYKVNRLILAEPNLIPEHATVSAKITGYGCEENFKENFRKFIERFNKKYNKSAQRFYNTLLETNYYALHRSALSLLKYSTRLFYSDFLRLNVERYIIKGENSCYKVDNRMIEDFNANNIPMFTVSSAGHGIMSDNPEEFYKIVSEVLG